MSGRAGELVLCLSWVALALVCGGCASFRNDGGAGSSDAGDAATDGTVASGEGGGDAAIADAADGGTTDGTSADVAGGDGGCGVTCGSNTEVLLFGGFDLQDLGDTWRFDGVTWSQSDGGAAPTGRLGPSMAPLHGAVLLFGGEDTNLTELGDTWVWSGYAWTQLADAGPPGRSNAGMATLGSDVVLFGGQGAQDVIGDTWA